MFKKTLYFLFSIFLSPVFVFSQKSSISGWQKNFFDSSEVVLPILYNAAIKNATSLEILDISKQSAYDDLALAKKELLRNISFNTGANYGNTNTSLSNQGGVVVPVYGTIGNRSNTSYSAGVSMGINLEQLLGGRRLRLHRQQLAIDQVEVNKKAGERAIRQQVINLYQNLVLSRTVLAHSEDALQSALVNKNLAEKQFQQGEILVNVQMGINDMYTSTVLARDQAANNYKTTLLLLEELIGMPVSTLMTSQQK